MNECVTQVAALPLPGPLGSGDQKRTSDCTSVFSFEFPERSSPKRSPVFRGALRLLQTSEGVFSRRTTSRRIATRSRRPLRSDGPNCSAVSLPGSLGCGTTLWNGQSAAVFLTSRGLRAGHDQLGVTGPALRHPGFCFSFALHRNSHSRSLAFAGSGGQQRTD